MSIFGALDTSVSGLQAQSSAFTNISDNIANSQTIGYKGVNTHFTNYLVQSTASNNGPDSVVANPEYTNTVEGTITQSSNPLSLAINGNGYFNVSLPGPTTTTAGKTTQTFDAQQYYTRAGDFTLNSSGYLVNGAGAYLDGWSVNPTTGTVNTSSLAPIQVSQGASPPVPTSNVTLSATLPTTPSSTPVTTQVDVYDSLGNMQPLNLSWSPVTGSANTWTLNVSSPNATPSTVGSATMAFNTNGTLSSITAGTGTTSPAAGQLQISPSYNGSAQPITLDFGAPGSTAGLTQYAGTSLNLQGVSQNGSPSGAFSNLSIDTQGNITANYTNGFSKQIAQIPLASFASPDALQNKSGQIETATQASGAATINAVGGSGGALVTGSVENSNVDIATQFTDLINAQQAYTANTKVVTAAQQILTTTVNMVQ
ncbi:MULTISPECIES: flagellar hook protein FlgE [Acidiphilium]|jgi:flagellar hook protein FlgE|uniref:Flagellar hook protein FlgE n=1 Tax=Acidiphilium cryptum (strain JF-5) TaxID=349163 RepID=A5FUQ6_ACICJ|nr:MULTISPECIES: flagellar hook protein FlgE [Acidiphilium]ABQ29338.1 flagellar basal body FlaE domain protein [Acidiphilium cryptum JF-5]KDM67255.1 flagellar hook protein FlgE [Acidiphilium sp. JA12-A1]UNC13391.1 flagellar hook protein FlgE [Acidiphilium multivorum]